MRTGLILAGGKNSRMGGRKKLFLELEGMTFLERIQEALKDIPDLFLSVEETGPYEHLKIPMIVDVIPGIGPMGGIYSGLLQCKEEALLVAACDMPFLTGNVVDILCKTYCRENKTVVAKTADRLHPLLGIYKKSDLPVLERMIREKNYKMMNFLKNIPYESVRLETERDCLQNINSLKEWMSLREGERNV